MEDPLGHAAASQPALRIRFGRFELDEADARLADAGEPVPLPPKPFALLCTLARTPRSLVTKDALLDSVWGHRFVTDSVLKSAISDVRAALQDDPREPRFIETVARRGYRFIAQVAESARASGATAPPPPARVARAEGPSFVGRADALEHLRTAWRAAAGGERRILWVSGEAGVGKTTLVDRFVAELGEAHCAHGPCVEQYGAGEPYLPVLEALTGLCRRDPTLADLMRDVAPSWLLQLPWLCRGADRDAVHDQLAGAGERRMLREMGELLDRYTQERPLLLVTEDLHWSDEATVQLLDYIARRRGTNRLLWLASFRTTEVVASDRSLRTVRQELRLHELVEEIELDAFSPQEVGQYVAARLPCAADDQGLVASLHRRTGGFPVYLTDIVDGLTRQREALADSGGSTWSVRGIGNVPENLAALIERYLRQLTPAEREVLEAASVLGMEFRLATLARVLGREATALARTCEELLRGQRWLREVPHTEDARGGMDYGFRHVLYREVLYQAMSRVTRVDLHRKAGDTHEYDGVERCEVNVAELASRFDLRCGNSEAARH